MPRTSIMARFVTAPTADDTAAVTRPTEFKICDPRPFTSSAEMLKPAASIWLPIDSTCVSTMACRLAACAANSDPVKTKVQYINPKTASTTMVRRKPRGIDNMRPSNRAPPSNIAARTMPPMMSRMGCASQMKAATKLAMPIHTAARFTSERMSGS